MKKVLILLAGILLGLVVGFYANYEVLQENAQLQDAIRMARGEYKRTLEMKAHIADVVSNETKELESQKNQAEDAAGQLSDILRCWMDHHPEEADSIFEYAKDFCDSATVEKYLSQYVYAY